MITTTLSTKTDPVYKNRTWCVVKAREIFDLSQMTVLGSSVPVLRF
jgi:hypothetical protein